MRSGGSSSRSSGEHKAAIISEIEENLALTNASSRKKSFEIDASIFSLCADRDQLVSALALQKALLHGVDRRFIVMVRCHLLFNEFNVC